MNLPIKLSKADSLETFSSSWNIHFEHPFLSDFVLDEYEFHHCKFLIFSLSVCFRFQITFVSQLFESLILEGSLSHSEFLTRNQVGLDWKQDNVYSFHLR